MNIMINGLIEITHGGNAGPFASAGGHYNKRVIK